MPMHIVIANLPPEVTSEGIKARLEALGVSAEITLNHEGDPTKVIAIVESEALERIAADQIAWRINGAIYHGRRLQAYVPLFMQG
jgi:RecJ-like exonuclease